MFLSLGYFSEHHPRCEEGTVWVKLQMREGRRAQKDKHLALFCSLEERRTLVICSGKRDQSPGLMCVQARQRSRGFWVTWRPGVHKWMGLYWACGAGGLAWLRPALCQLIMPVGLDCKKEPLLKLTPSYTRNTIQHPQNLICSYGCWAQHPLGFFFLILPESACFVSERGCFFYRLICHGKGIESMSLWLHRGGHRPNKDQLSKHWPGRDITRKPPRTNFSFQKG